VDAREHDSSIRTEVASIAVDLSRGSLTALTRLYDAVTPRLIRYSEMLTRNRADAEDALQTTLVRIARNPRQLAKAENPWAYLVRMTRNEAFKIVEKRRQVPSLAAQLRTERAAEIELEARESREQIQNAIRRLPSEQAEVVVLKIWENFTFAEIAEMTGESPNTAASRYRYALEKLSRFLQSLSGAECAGPRPSSLPAFPATRTRSEEVGHA